MSDGTTPRPKVKTYPSWMKGFGKKAKLRAREAYDLKVGRLSGVGERRAYEAIAYLDSIPKDDPLRRDAFLMVRDWIEHNR